MSVTSAFLYLSISIGIFGLHQALRVPYIQIFLQNQGEVKKNMVFQNIILFYCGFLFCQNVLLSASLLQRHNPAYIHFLHEYSADWLHRKNHWDFLPTRLLLPGFPGKIIQYKALLHAQTFYFPPVNSADQKETH